MRKLVIACIAILATLTIGSPLYGAGDYEKSSAMQGDKGSVEGPLASHFIGKHVFSENGDEIGRIKQVTLDDETGNIRFFTLTRGGIMGVGGEDIAVPRDALLFEGERAFLTVDAKMLDNAPKQADMDVEEFTRDLESHYGISPAWKEPGPETKVEESGSAAMPEE